MPYNHFVDWVNGSSKVKSRYDYDFFFIDVNLFSLYTKLQSLRKKRAITHTCQTPLETPTAQGCLSRHDFANRPQLRRLDGLECKRRFFRGLFLASFVINSLSGRILYVVKQSTDIQSLAGRKVSVASVLLRDGSLSPTALASNVNTLRRSYSVTLFPRNYSQRATYI